MKLQIGFRSGVMGTRIITLIITCHQCVPFKGHWLHALGFRGMSCHDPSTVTGVTAEVPAEGDQEKNYVDSWVAVSRAHIALSCAWFAHIPVMSIASISVYSKVNPS